MSPRRKTPAPVAVTAADDNANDFVMARLGAGRAGLQGALAGVDDMLGLFVAPGDDSKGKERKEAMDTILELLGEATRSLELAAEELDECDFEMGEPWDDEEEEDEKP